MGLGTHPFAFDCLLKYQNMQKESEEDWSNTCHVGTHCTDAGAVHFSSHPLQYMECFLGHHQNQAY
jgi:hypothetical protein